MKPWSLIFFYLILHFYSWSQKTIKTTTPCNDNVLFKTPGRWLMAYNELLNTGSEHLGFNRAQVKEVTNRMDAVHQMLLKIYPQPMAIDAEWHHTIGSGSFGEQVKFVKKSPGIQSPEVLKAKPVAVFGYVCGFFRYYCNPRNAYEIWPGSPGETGTRLNVFANSIDPVASISRTGDPDYSDDLADVFTIGGYPMRLRHSLNKKLGEFELLSIENFKTRYLIVHRKGMLPYIPVTRKQYLDRCIVYVTNWWKNGMKSIEQMPVAGMEEQKVRDEQIKKVKIERDAALKLYQDELFKTANNGLLDAPAIVSSFLNPFLENTTIFVDEKEGKMVVIENADYMRKDLPKYVPQLFVVKWTWEDWPLQADIGKLIEEKFPFDKLQAMLDK